MTCPYLNLKDSTAGIVILSPIISVSASVSIKRVGHFGPPTVGRILLGDLAAMSCYTSMKEMFRGARCVGPISKGYISDQLCLTYIDYLPETSVRGRA